MAYLQTDLGPMEGGIAQYSNYPQNHAPKWAANLAYQHIWTLGNGGNLVMKGDIHWETGSWRTWKEPYGSWQPSYHKENVSMIYDSPSGTWSVQGYVKNIFEVPVMAYYVPGFAPNANWPDGMPDKYALQPPRTVGVMLTVRY